MNEIRIPTDDVREIMNNPIPDRAREIEDVAYLAERDLFFRLGCQVAGDYLLIQEILIEDARRRLSE